MFYRPDLNDHGLPQNPFKSCIVPRPIAWISTCSPAGAVNLAPFSQSAMVGSDPPYVMFSAGGHNDAGKRKDSVEYAEATGEFVYNVATYELRDAVNLTGQITDSGIDELHAAGLTAAPSRLVRAPRVAESPINLECRVQQIVQLPGQSWQGTLWMVIGRVIGIHIADHLIGADGKIDIGQLKPLARLGYMDYAAVDAVFELGAIDPAHADTWRKAMGG